MRLEEEVRGWRRFADILSHDLLNPLWVAENYLRLLAAQGPTEPQRPLLGAALGALEKARTVLLDARTYLSLEDAEPIVRPLTDVRDLVGAAAESLRARLEERHQELALFCAEPAPVPAGPALGEVFTHLLSNASKFSPEGSRIEIEVRAGNPCRIEVRDRGPGVAPEEREGIFRRFERNEKGGVVGVGLGLAIVRRILALHGGRVWVEGREEGGSIFIIELPQEPLPAPW